MGAISNSLFDAPTLPPFGGFVGSTVDQFAFFAQESPCLVAVPFRPTVPIQRSERVVPRTSDEKGAARVCSLPTPALN